METRRRVETIYELLDGCGYFRFVTRIVFPLTLPAIATVAVLHAIGIWNELILPTIYL